MEIKKILVSRTDKIGDLVLSIPSIYMIRKMYKEAEIIVLTRKYNADVISSLPYITSIIKIDDYNEKDLENKIISLKLDVFIALFSNQIIARLAKKSKAKIRIGPYSKFSSFFSYNKGKIQKRSWSFKNEAEYNLDLVRRLNKKKFDENFEINTKIEYKKENFLFVQKIIDDLKIDQEKIIMINPVSGGSGKNLREKEYLDLIKIIEEKYTDHSIVVISSAMDRDKILKLKKELELSRVHFFENNGSILNSVAFIDRAKVYVGSSTGPTHIAGSLKKNIVAIYSLKASHSPKRWGVYNDKNVIYIQPEKGVVGNYKIKYFENYTKEDRDKIIEGIDFFLKNDKKRK